MAKDEVAFADKLSVLVSMEAAKAHADPERMAVIVERLTHSLAFTIAMASHGDAKTMAKFLEGVEAYLYETAASHAPMGEFMNRARARP